MSGLKHTLRSQQKPDKGLGPCATHYLFRVFGDRWSLPVLGLLLVGPMRFAELKTALSPVSHRMLVLSLKKLERLGLVAREAAPTSPPQVTYRLTELGLSFRKPLSVIHAWTVENKAKMLQAVEVFNRNARR